MLTHHFSPFPSSYEFVKSKTLRTPNNFTNKLIEESHKKCLEYLSKDDLGSIGVCQKDMMIASSCVLLTKANAKLGDMRDHLGDCKYEIKLAQESLVKSFPNFPLNRMNKWLWNLGNSIYSFA